MTLALASFEVGTTDCSVLSWVLAPCFGLSPVVLIISHAPTAVATRRHQDIKTTSFDEHLQRQAIATVRK